MTLHVQEAPLEATVASELPPARLEIFLWRMAAEPSFHIEQSLLSLDDTCSERLGAPADRAYRDRAGIMHLYAGDRSACYGRDRRSTWCETQGRVGDVIEDVSSVPAEERCYRATGYWPPPLEGTSARAKVRRILVANLGAGCATCDDPFATKIDHDHATGAVRGYLCTSCNTCVDLCRHVAGCRFADYLNSPPAEGLGLEYPGWRSIRSSRRYRTRLAAYGALLIGDERA